MALLLRLCQQGPGFSSRWGSLAPWGSLCPPSAPPRSPGVPPQHPLVPLPQLGAPPPAPPSPALGVFFLSVPVVLFYS